MVSGILVAILLDFSLGMFSWFVCIVDSLVGGIGQGFFFLLSSVEMMKSSLRRLRSLSLHKHGHRQRKEEGLIAHQDELFQAAEVSSHALFLRTFRRGGPF